MGKSKKTRGSCWCKDLPSLLYTVFNSRILNVKSNIQAPEVPIDNRSLFEKLQEQKDLKEMQWQEEHAFKNNTFNKALEEDEAQFLDAVDAARWFDYI